MEQVRSREPDTLVFIVHAVPSAPMQRILYEVYRDRAAYERHQRAAVRASSSRPTAGRYVLATNVIELGLQQAKVSPFPSVAELFGEPGYDTSGFERPDFLRDYGRTSGAARRGRRDAPVSTPGATDHAAVPAGLPPLRRGHGRSSSGWPPSSASAGRSATSPGRLSDLAQYSEMIPVTFVDGVQHDFWRVSEDRLRAALRTSSLIGRPRPRCPS